MRIHVRADSGSDTFTPGRVEISFVLGRTKEWREWECAREARTDHNTILIGFAGANANQVWLWDAVC